MSKLSDPPADSEVVGSDEEHAGVGSKVLVVVASDDGKVKWRNKSKTFTLPSLGFKNLLIYYP